MYLDERTVVSSSVVPLSKRYSGPVLGRQSCLEIGDFTVLSSCSDGDSDGLFLASLCEVMKNRFLGALCVAAWRAAVYGGRVDFESWVVLHWCAVSEMCCGVFAVAY